ncbi:ABC transporter permease [Shouchella miscanthi]|uniref:ABC transporter permease n=1 Tax=Shouchella miscanthi TaxID=2598861 RepID=UPI00119F915F|nr:ABC transporter permease [Shouchella miscanthi]
MDRARKQFTFRQVRFFFFLSTGFFLLLTLVNLNGRGEYGGFFLYTSIQFIILMLHGFLLFLVHKRRYKDNERDGVSKGLAWVLLFGVFTGNVFASLAAFYVVKEKRTATTILAFYMILADVLVILVSLVNLFKPYVANTFIPSMILLFSVLLIHLLFFFALPFIQKSTRNRKRGLGILLLLTVVTGNLFVLFVLYTMFIQEQQKRGLLEKLISYPAPMIGLFFILFLFMISVSSYGVFDYGDAITNNYSTILAEPSLAHPFGTDNYGRDVFSRVIFGARISLIVGFVATLVPFVIGGILGAISGYFGRRSDNVIMRSLDVLYAIPDILLAITIIAAFGASTVNLILALSVGAIPGYARTMRANVLQVSNLEYVESARALGANHIKVLVKHVIPNAMSPMIIRSTLTVGTAVLATSSLSYLGLGVEPHIPEWGNILRLGSSYLESQPHLALFPGLAIILLVLSFNFLGDGLRDATDPRLS